MSRRDRVGIGNAQTTLGIVITWIKVELISTRPLESPGAIPRIQCRSWMIDLSTAKRPEPSFRLLNFDPDTRVFSTKEGPLQICNHEEMATKVEELLRSRLGR